MFDYDLFMSDATGAALTGHDGRLAELAAIRLRRAQLDARETAVLAAIAAAGSPIRCDRAPI